MFADNYLLARAMGTLNRRTFMTSSLMGVSLGLLSGFKRMTRAAVEFARPKTVLKGADFSFIHFSDTHIDPRPRDQLFNADGRSLKTLEWLARCSREPVVQTPYGLEGHLPSFAIHTGDVMEYGPVGYAWQDFENAIASISCPVSLVPGNHDNTWGEINHRLRKTYGDDSYSFDFGGYHFLCINSSGLLDPLPCFDRRTLDWLAADLAVVPPETPLFLAMHHPLSGNAGYASDFDKLRLWKLLVGRRVAFIMDGHWHTVHCESWQGIERVNGGATFGEHTGYNTVTLKEGTLRVMFRYEQESVERPQLVPLLEKDLKDVAPLTDYPLEVPKESIAGSRLPVRISKLPPGSRVRCWIDSDTRHRYQLPKVWSGNKLLIDTDSYCPGWHFVSARVRLGKKQVIKTAEQFKLLPHSDVPYRVCDTNLGAGIKTLPLVKCGQIIVANTSGQVFGLSRCLEKNWIFDTQSQVVHSLAAGKRSILVGDIEGNFYCLDMIDGGCIWRISLPNALYSAAAVQGGHAYIGDSAGWIHAIRIECGQIQWSQEVTSYGFETQPLVVERQLIAGCWDGYIYSLDCETGDVLWKSWSPKGQHDVKSRYYGAADNPLVYCGESLFVSDRGWMLGRYNLSGDFLEVLEENVASLSASPSRQSIYAKRLDNYLVKMDTTGRHNWKAEVPTGRVPNQPVEVAGRVAVLSDTGILTLLDSDSGQQVFQYSISPRLYCLSGIGTDGVGTFVAADMDGTVTSLVLLDV